MSEKSLADKVVEAVTPERANFDFHKAMYDLLTVVEEPTEASLRANRERIAELADYCRSSQLYQKSKDRNDVFCKDLSAVEVYREMLYKIVHAPVRLMADGTAILFLPSIDDKLKLEAP